MESSYTIRPLVVSKNLYIIVNATMIMVFLMGQHLDFDNTLFCPNIIGKLDVKYSAGNMSH